MKVDINSTANPKVKWVKSLHNNSARRREGVFLVEGSKEITYAIDGGFKPVTFFICPDIYNDSLSGINTEDVFTVNKVVFEKISYRSGSDGIIAIFQSKSTKLDSLNLSSNPSLLVLEAVEKPGNLGAIIRTADGAGIDGVIICDEKTDFFNPNVIRSSVGLVFTKQVANGTKEEAYDFLQKHEITAYGAIISDKSRNYTDTDFTPPSAIILGTEHDGLSEFWQTRSKPIMIPMKGLNDSLNVSNAAAVISYELVRQRSEATEHTK